MKMIDLEELQKKIDRVLLELDCEPFEKMNVSDRIIGLIQDALEQVNENS